ncbi:MAG: leucine-rich repeat domain-containing protein, partial [Oscillospiraceae bacterium]
FRGCTSLTAITLPESLTHIGDYTFSGCTSLTAITLPESLTHIGAGAFRGCTSLTAITLPESLTSIGDWAFSGCTSLTAITLPESLTSIGAGAFRGCASLTAITRKKFNGDIVYKTMCADEYLAVVGSHRNFSGGIELYEAQLLVGMRGEELILKDCHIAEKEGIFAHGETIKEALHDLRFKLAEDRGAEQYQHLNRDNVLQVEDAIAMYRIITGACKFGTEQFLSGMEEIKDAYSVQEIMDITAGQYGGTKFAAFFER